MPVVTFDLDFFAAVLREITSAHAVVSDVELRAFLASITRVVLSVIAGNDTYSEANFVMIVGRGFVHPADEQMNRFVDIATDILLAGQPFLANVDRDRVRRQAQKIVESIISQINREVVESWRAIAYSRIQMRRIVLVTDKDQKEIRAILDRPTEDVICSMSPVSESYLDYLSRCLGPVNEGESSEDAIHRMLFDPTTENVPHFRTPPDDVIAQLVAKCPDYGDRTQDAVEHLLNKLNRRVYDIQKIYRNIYHKKPSDFL